MHFSSLVCVCIPSRLARVLTGLLIEPFLCIMKHLGLVVKCITVAVAAVAQALSITGPLFPTVCLGLWQPGVVIHTQCQWCRNGKNPLEFWSISNVSLATVLLVWKD